MSDKTAVSQGTCGCVVTATDDRVYALEVGRARGNFNMQACFRQLGHFKPSKMITPIELF